MIAGNHDAALADSVWTRAIQLGCVPANVHVPLRSAWWTCPAPTWRCWPLRSPSATPTMT